MVRLAFSFTRLMRCSLLDTGVAAVDGDLAAGRVLRRVRRQIYDGALEVRGVSHAALQAVSGGIDIVHRVVQAEHMKLLTIGIRWSHSSRSFGLLSRMTLVRLVRV